MKSALERTRSGSTGRRKQFPSTRLGTAAAIRDALVKTANYLAKRDHEGDEPAERDLRWGLSLVRPARSPASTAAGPTTSPPPCAWPTSSATAW